ncbi:alanine racemase [Nocardioides marmoriginsengisoli]|uniref:Alanine racemase n=1 Tax=Nocardioides marmoriginsengisoli TaxID=661483 RepID=A0A3N0CDS9_9ACTN|nr:alanine racemase [Nocardioides marmoriginsengisoli]RNL61216.1 alanine racemase [Nocardioides marmoriginsengisoli]
MSPSATPTPRAEIVVDLAAFRQNLDRLGELVATDTDGPAVMVVVKADAYGHGLVECARAAREAGVPWLGVATQTEALALRAAGDEGRLLSWLGVPGEDYGDAVGADIDVSASSVQQLNEIAAGTDSSGMVARVHLKVDTGLSRNGAPRSEWRELFEAGVRLQEEDRVDIVGIWSHFACADQPAHHANDQQVAAFDEALALAEELGLDPEVRHLANSAGALLRPDAWFDLVRFGIAAYGINPAPDVLDADELGLTPIMTVRADVALTKEIGRGDGVSYGHTYVSDRRQHVALIPLGYGDGVPRHASGRAEVRVGDAHCRILGRVCMDQFVVAVPDSVQAGDDAVLFGPGTAGEPTVDDWAEACGTISYEIVTRIGGAAGRVHRRWVNG